MSLIEITQKNFDEVVLKSDKKVLIDFWSTWCGPCKTVIPILEEIEKEYAGKLKVGKINVETEQQLGVQFGISALPTLLIFNNGAVENQIIGIINKEKILEKLDIK